MSDQPKPERSARERALSALALIVKTADRAKDENRAILAFACAKPYDKVLYSEWQMLFLGGAFHEVSDARSACNYEFISRFFSDEAKDFAEQHCASPYWFWTLLGETAQLVLDRANADETALPIPMTLADMHAARATIRDRQSEIFSKFAGNIADGTYSGPYLPRHLEKAFEKSPWLHNVRHHREAGFVSGHLLMEPTARGLIDRVLKLGQGNAIFMRAILNPLLFDIDSKIK